MGSGKSYIGRPLAAKLSFQFVDVDNIIENTEGVKIARIFENKGETYFRQLESDILRGLGKWDDIVIATGGGAACFHKNMDWMNEQGVTIYLKASPELLLSRLNNETHKRPLLAGRTDADLLHFIESKIAERAIFYEKATLIIEQISDSEDIVVDIINALYNRISQN